MCRTYKKCALYYIKRASFAPYIEMLPEKDLKCNWYKVCAGEKERCYERGESYEEEGSFCSAVCY